MDKMKMKKLFELTYGFESRWLNALANIGEMEFLGGKSKIIAREKHLANSHFTTYAACIAIIKENGGFDDYKKYADWDERFERAMELELA